MYLGVHPIRRGGPASLKASNKIRSKEIKLILIFNYFLLENHLIFMPEGEFAKQCYVPKFFKLFFTKKLSSRLLLDCRLSKATFTPATFSCENRHFAFLLFQIEKEKTRASVKEKRQNADSRS